MERITTVAGLRAWREERRRAGERVALVPTMGALHEGHLRLVDAARRHADRVVMSIFVNPLQFAPGEDFERYPRPVQRDAALAAGRGVDALFLPDVEEMYGAGRELRIVPGETAARWEGASRPGHFDGVLTVVAKLFNMTTPDEAVFGQKDIQHVTLVRRMIAELNFPVTLRVLPTVREADGLALSSRNVYLAPPERQAALALSRAVRAAEAAWQGGERSGAALQAAADAVCRAEPGIATEYIAVMEPDHLAPVERAEAGTIVALAARVGKTRLIDNTILS